MKNYEQCHNEKNIGFNFKYCLTRIWKLLSPYWFTLVIIWIYISPTFGFEKYSGDYKWALLDFFPVSDIFGHGEHMISGVLWYMNFALIEICILPIIYALIKRFDVIVIVATAVLYAYIPVGIHSLCGGDYHAFIFSIEFGVLFAHSDVFSSIEKFYRKMHIITKIVLAMFLTVISFAFPYTARFKEFFFDGGVTAVRPMLQTFGAIALITFICM